MLQTLTTFLTLGSMAAAAPHVMARGALTAPLAAAPTTHNLFVGGPSQILLATFNGTDFQVTGQHAEAGSSPSWMRWKASTKTLYAVNEYGVDLDVFGLKPEGPVATASANGSSGVVFLEFNKDETRMVGAGYGSATLDVWDTSAAAPKLMKQVNITGTLGPNQTAHHPHQALLDPSGRFMVVPDLGGDQILVLRVENDAFAITNSVSLFAGAGPRHGSFVAGAGGKTYFIVACELSNLVVLYEVSYTDKEGIAFKWISEQSSYGGTTAAKNTTSAAVGAVLVAGNQRDVYVSNRLTGGDADSIARFAFDADKATLAFQDSTSTAGIGPRSMAFSTDKDQAVLFVANQGGASGLAAFSRDAATGKLSATPIGSKAGDQLVAKGLETTPLSGPQFVSAYNA
ncbi:Lactonase, 7-bladed beta-propeller-domain-containing protein [Nemania diffusa]|nr:Lactonase, 7-bladed beta-propeller-domain-containing protein [Nemania diffusa]